MMPVLVGLFFSLPWFAWSHYIGNEWTGHRSSLDEAIIESCVVFVFLFISIYLYQIINGRSALEIHALICTKCLAIKPFGKERQCECGGQLEPLEDRMQRLQEEKKRLEKQLKHISHT